MGGWVAGAKCVCVGGGGGRRGDKSEFQLCINDTICEIKYLRVFFSLFFNLFSIRRTLFHEN